MTGLRNSAAADARKDAAVDWFLRRGAGPLSAAEAQAFETWLAQAPENEETYAALDLVWSATMEARDHPAVSARGRELVKAVDRARTTRRTVTAVVGALMLTGAGAGWYAFTAPKPLATQAFETAVGQRATVTLPDGSKVTLNTDTVVRTASDPHRRLVYLDKGQAFFKVAHDQRHPFIVAAAGRMVTAVGTAFDVRVDQGKVTVILVEGKVKVEAPAPRSAEARRPGAAPAPANAEPVVLSTEMTAGSELVAPDAAAWRLSRADVGRETSWLHGEITFDDEPLGDIVAELNRYSTRKIVIDDEALAGVRLGGIYKPGDIEGFSRALRAYGVADVREESEGELHVVALK